MFLPIFLPCSCHYLNAKLTAKALNKNTKQTIKITRNTETGIPNHHPREDHGDVGRNVAPYHPATTCNNLTKNNEKPSTKSHLRGTRPEKPPV